MHKKSRMSREVHVRFCERFGVKFPLPTRPEKNMDFDVFPFRHYQKNGLSWGLLQKTPQRLKEIVESNPD